MSSKLSHYLKTYRKKSGLSQEDVACLLGHRSGAHVCRYERRTRLPGLPIILALEIIYRTPARELFAGIYEKVRTDLFNRVGCLKAVYDGQEGACARQRCESLETILEEDLPTIEF